MALETGDYIDDLVQTNPVGSTDTKSTLDDHIRLIKKVLKQTFPSLTGPMTCTQAELNVLDGYTGTAADIEILSGIIAAGVTNADIDLLAGLAAGGLTNTELSYINTLASNAQTQIDSKGDFSPATDDRASQAVSASGTWVIPAGWHALSFDGSGVPVIQLRTNAGSWNTGSGQFAGGLVYSDGTNMRLIEFGGSAGFTAYYRTISS